ncbi:hypothetical protein ACRAWF_32995 [Streptomyces sp. L7]
MTVVFHLPVSSACPSGSVYSVAGLVAGAAGRPHVGGSGRASPRRGLPPPRSWGCATDCPGDAGPDQRHAMPTLATSFLLAGLAVILATSGTPVLIDSGFLKGIGQNTYLGLSFPVFILAAVVIVTVLLRTTKFGRDASTRPAEARRRPRLLGRQRRVRQVAAFALSAAAAVPGRHRRGGPGRVRGPQRRDES